MTGQIWKRLWWKEFRESWLALLLIFITPMLLVAIIGSYSDHSREADFLRFISGCGMLMVVAMWSAVKASREQSKSEYTCAHLPVNRLGSWFITSFSPMIAVGVIFFCVGKIFAGHQGWAYYTLFAEIMALEAMAIFAICQLLSRTISQWFSIAVGVLASLVAYAYVLSTFEMVNGGQMFRFNNPDLSQYDYLIISVRFFALAVIGPLISSFILTIFSGKKPLPITRIALTGLAVLIIAAPYAKEIKQSLLGKHSLYKRCSLKPIGLPDGSLIVKQIYTKNRALFGSDLMYEDQRRGIIITRRFSNMILPIGFSGRDVVWLAQQCPKEDNVAILKWDVANNSTVKVLEIPAGEDALIQEPYLQYKLAASISPNNRNILIDIKSSAGTGMDLWLVDLKTRESIVVKPNREVYRYGVEQVDWHGGQVFMSGYGKCLVVDIPTGTVKAVSIDWANGGHK
ncbi:MAG: hypothetical protein Q7N50_08520 [Armatimonadota bacterium]|nr:hypothetical protein [Armatimonadota bacterium]